MKLKDGVIFTKVAEETIVVTVGEAANAFKGMIKLNSTGAFIAENMQNADGIEKTVSYMQKDFEVADLVALLCKEYEIDEETAVKAAESVLEKFQSVGLVKE